MRRRTGLLRLAVRARLLGLAVTLLGDSLRCLLGVAVPGLTLRLLLRVPVAGLALRRLLSVRSGLALRLLPTVRARLVVTHVLCPLQIFMRSRHPD